MYCMVMKAFQGTTYLHHLHPG